MKKTIFCLLIAVFVICGFNQVFAINTDEYSINIPNSYNKVAENSYTKESGTNVNVQVNQFSGQSDSVFTNEFLDYFEKQIDNYIISLRDELKDELKAQYGASVSEDTIENYLKTVKIDNIEKKEIITATKNNYKCAHILSKYSILDSSYYTDQYFFVSNNKSYVLTAAVQDRSEVDSSEIKDIINSFTIANYKEPEGKKIKNLDKILETVLGVIFAFIIGSIIDAVRRKKAKKAKENNVEENAVENKKEVETNETVQPIESENSEDSQENRFCPNCGNKVGNDAEFCGNCGHKLK